MDVKRWFIILGVACASLCFGQIPSGDGFLSPSHPSQSSESAPAVQSTSVGVADMKQDIEANRKDLKDLALRVEQLEREKAELEAKLAKNSDTSSFVTHDELKLLEMRTNDAIAAEGKRVESAIKDDMKAAMTGTSPVSAAEKPSVSAKTAVTKPGRSIKSAAPQISEAEKQSYMKEGIKYTVAPGDTISSIARKNHSSVRAIMATNPISDPGKLYVGREIFVPTL